MFALRTRALWALLSSSLVYGALVQKSDLILPPGSSTNRDAVVAMFKRSYQSYKDNAWGHDDLLPLTNGSSDGRNGWGATIADAMSTMYVMGLNDTFEEAVDYMSNVDFSQSKTSDTVSIFETTIRYLGGMLSAYELSGRVYPKLLDRSIQLADNMAFAWSGATDIPWGHFDFSTRKPEVATSNIAEAGTLTLEWYTLSQYAVNDTYRQLAEGAARRIASQSAPLPGLPAQGIDPSSGKSVGGYVTWGGGSDSYFEYLIKYARLNPDADDLFTDNWRLAVDSSIATLLKISSVGKHAYIADYDGSKQIRHVGSHLACFYGGNLIFGGRILNNDTIVNVGLQLTDACWNTYASTATGIGPEVFAFTSDDGGYTGGDAPTAEQSAFNALHGFYITSADYILRPEVLESNFYAWRATGDTKYVARAASALKSFDQYLSTNGAYAGIWDVNDNNVSDDQNRINDMESFWFAEVLKYLFLTFDDPCRFSLDDYVFNTEAHPFKLSAPKSQYGSGAQPTPAATSTFKMNQGQTPEVSQIAGMPSIKDSIQGVISKVGQTVLQ